MRVLTIYQNTRPGGFYYHLLKAIRAMLVRGWEVHHINLERPDIRHKNFHFHHVKSSRLPLPTFLTFSRKAVEKMHELEAKTRFDKIVVFGDLYSYVASKNRSGTPIYTFIRGDFEWEGRKRIGAFVKFTEPLLRKGFMASKKIVCVNGDLAERIQKKYGIPKERLRVLPNSIPEGVKFARKKWHEGPKTIGFVGCFDEIKNLENLLRAFAMVRKRQEARLVLVGAGSKYTMRKETQLKRLVDGLGIGGSVEFTKWTDDKPFRIFDLFVLPSFYEGSPTVLLEAIGSGIPSIGSNRGGIKEILEYDELLFEPEDFREIADKMSKILGNRLSYQEAVKNIEKRQKKFRFDWEKKAIGLLE